MGDSERAHNMGVRDPDSSQVLPFSQCAISGNTKLFCLNKSGPSTPPSSGELPGSSTLDQGWHHNLRWPVSQRVPPISHYCICRAPTKSKSQSSKVTLPTHVLSTSSLETSAALLKPQLQGQRVSLLFTFRSQYHPKAEGFAGEIIVITLGRAGCVNFSCSKTWGEI